MAGAGRDDSASSRMTDCAMPLNKPTLVAVAHENVVVAAGLRCILESEPGFEVAAAFDRRRGFDGDEQPDLLVADHETAVSWAGRHACEPQGPRNILVAAMIGEETDVRRALEIGVHGYVILNCSAEEIARAARAVAEGQRYLCSTATSRMADSLMQPALTARESEVLELVARGRNNKEVARSLGISLGTVKAHMRGLLGKLDARCRTEALWIAAQRGLIVRAAAGGIREKEARVQVLLPDAIAAPARSANDQEVDEGRSRSAAACA